LVCFVPLTWRSLCDLSSNTCNTLHSLRHFNYVRYLYGCIGYNYYLVISLRTWMWIDVLYVLFWRELFLFVTLKSICRNMFNLSRAVVSSQFSSEYKIHVTKQMLLLIFLFGVALISNAKWILLSFIFF